MRIVVADLQSKDGFVSKDTVAGGYGSRFRPFSRTTRIAYEVKRRLNPLPSVQLGYVAALCASAGHEVAFTSGDAIDGDVTFVLTSLVDYRHEIAWAAQQRARGSHVGFVGLAASKLPQLFLLRNLSATPRMQVDNQGSQLLPNRTSQLLGR